MKWVKWLLVVVLLAFVGWRVWQRVFVTEEQRVQRVLDTLTDAVEHGNLVKLEDSVAGDYSDDFGLDKSSLLGAVHSYRSEYDAIFVHLSDLKITVDPDHQKATAVFIAKILTKPKGELTKSELRQDRFRVLFRKTDAGWKMYRAESPELKFE